MFDWPAQTQTSPTCTSRIRIVFAPETVSSKGPPARRSDSTTRHRPPAAFADAVFPWIRTVTASPSVAVPQTGTSVPR